MHFLHLPSLHLCRSPQELGGLPHMELAVGWGGRQMGPFQDTLTGTEARRLQQQAAWVKRGREP